MKKLPIRHTRRRASPPPARRSFLSGWDEIVYLYHRVLHWFYGESLPSRARPFAKRLERLLRREATSHETIKGEECWSLVHELKGNLRKAIEYRKSEIRLMKRLLAARSREEKAGAGGRHYWPDDYSDLADRLALLAMLYTRAGDTKSAVASIKAAARLAETHGFVLESQELFDDLVSPGKDDSGPGSRTRKSSAKKRRA